jgi:hypothetical protein
MSLAGEASLMRWLHNEEYDAPRRPRMTLTVVDDIFFNVAERGLYVPLKAGTFQPSGYKALVRGDRGKLEVLASVRDSYKLVTNREVYDALQPVLAPYDTDIYTYYDRGGAKSYIDCRFNGVSRGYGGAAICFRTIFINGYGGTSLGAKIGAINSFCTNGSILGEYEGSYRRHTSGLDVSIAADWVEAGLKKWEVVNEKWTRWLKEEISTDHSHKAVTEMSESEDHQGKMIRTLVAKYIPVYGNTRFALYQTLTDYATHFDSYRQRAVNNNSPHEREIRLLAKAEQVMSRIAA